jgi:transcriptional regulator with XRE-family HTH domain
MTKGVPVGSTEEMAPMSKEKTDDKSNAAPRRPVPEDGIGQRIKEAREARDWTQSVVSVRTKLIDPNEEGISRTVLVGYESGKTKPGAREIRLLAEVLRVTPNWLLYGAEKPFHATLPSMEYLQGDDEFEKALRLSLALFLLKPHERELIGSLMLSLAGRELGDIRLSGLMMLARTLSKEWSEKIKAEMQASTIEEAIRESAESGATNWGTGLKFDEGEIVGGEIIYPGPLDPAPPEDK